MTTSTSPIVTSTSKLFNINYADFSKGMIMAVGGAVFTVVENSIEAGIFTLDWTNIWHIAVGALVLYLGKNFFTPGKTVVSGLPEGTTATITIPPAGKSITVPPSNKPPVDGAVAK
jgi:hypothetical protein